MQRLALVVCLLLAGCTPPVAEYPFPPPSAPPEPVWQEGPNGWVYDRSPLHLWPSGFRNSEITRLPDRIVFAAGEATLDRNGRQVALLQGQRLRQLPNHLITLFCGWSEAEAEAARLDTEALRMLAAGRCDAVAQVYHGLGVPLGQIGQRFVAPLPGQNEEQQRAVRLTVVPSGSSGRVYRLPEEPLDNPTLGHRNGGLFGLDRYDYNQGLYLPEVIYFDWGSAELDANARSLLQTFADWIYPDEKFAMVFNCDQIEGERPADEAENGLARDRCEATRAFLGARGLCSQRLIHGPGGRTRDRLRNSDFESDEYVLGAWLDQFSARDHEDLLALPCPLEGFRAQ